MLNLLRNFFSSPQSKSSAGTTTPTADTMRHKANPKSWSNRLEPKTPEKDTGVIRTERPSKPPFPAEEAVKAVAVVRRSGRISESPQTDQKKPPKTSEKRSPEKAVTAHEEKPSRAAKLAAKMSVSSGWERDVKEKAKGLSGSKILSKPISSINWKLKVKPKNSAKVNSKKPDVNLSPLDDLLPHIFTWVCEPKQASAQMIKTYISQHHSGLDAEGKAFKVALMQGVELGQLRLVKGTGSSGTFQLVDGADKTGKKFEDAIEDAIIAMNEPKEASIKSLRMYLNEFHLEYRIGQNPKTLMRALKRCEAKGSIIRISGVGMSGSFRLVHPYHPSPKDLWREWYEGDDDGDIPSVKAEKQPVVEMSEDSEESDEEEQEVEVVRDGRKRGRPFNASKGSVTPEKRVRKAKPPKKAVTTTTALSKYLPKKKTAKKVKNPMENAQKKKKMLVPVKRGGNASVAVRLI